jgi:cytochrome d ubiquinol oxidase subunit II
METIWFILVALMLTTYVVLDGFDIGAGILHLVIARTDAERRLVLRTIGPVWDGNEVWLIAGGGTLFFAFPLLYASAFSGFYLALTIVLWLLILRGIGIEFRAHTDSIVWHGLFDGFFALSSVVLALMYGAALANVLRGVPLQPDRFFFEPLWTNWQPGLQPGILDWYTVIGGVTALLALAVHGAAYIAVKTAGQINLRARRAAIALWPSLLAATAVSLLATIAVRPRVTANFLAHPVLLLIPTAVLGVLTAMRVCLQRARDRDAFLSSAVFLAAMLAGASVAQYPVLLPATADRQLDLTIYNSVSGPHALRFGLIWWTGGMLIAIIYTAFVYRSFAGKVAADPPDLADRL